MTTDPTPTTDRAKYGLDNGQDLTDNDLDPTEPQPGDFDDWWTDQWREYADLIADDPLLGVLLGAPHEVIMPEGCTHDH